MEIDEVISALKDMLNYARYAPITEREIESLKEPLNIAVDAMKKQQPMKAGEHGWDTPCPNCGTPQEYPSKYCPDCGQRLEWE